MSDRAQNFAALQEQFLAERRARLREQARADRWRNWAILGWAAAVAAVVFFGAASAAGQIPNPQPGGAPLAGPAAPGQPAAQPAPVIATQFLRGQTENEALALALAHLRGQAFPPAWRYLWLPQTSSRLVGGARFVVNATINRTDRGVALDSLDGGRLMAVNLLALANDFAQFIELAGLWELLADRDFYFHERAQLIEALVVSPGCQLHVGGKPDCALPTGFVIAPTEDRSGWLACHLVGKRGWVHRSKLQLAKIAPFAAHVAAEMTELQSLTGSRAAFLRGDDFVRLAFSTLDEGIYYDLLGIADLNLAQIMARAGAAETELNKHSPFNWGAVFTSLVTGDERAYLLAPALGVAPEKSRSVMGLTFDFRSDNRRDDPLGTLFMFLTGNRFDAGEAIFMLPNGFPYGILYDGQGRLQDVAPPEVATDPTDRTPHHQLQAGISCNRCHDLWWKDAGNNVRWALNNGKTRGGIYGISDPRLAGLTTDQVFSKLSSSYRANINQTLDESRRIMAAQIAGACGVSAQEAIDGASELYAAASYGDHRLADDNWSVSPRLVLERHGVMVTGNPTALELRAAFDRVFPARDIAEGVVEFSEVAGWRLWEASGVQIDAPQPRMEQLRRSYTYLASIRDLSTLEQAKQ